MQWSDEIINDTIHNLHPIAINEALLRKLISVIDLTSLNANDTEATIANLCADARTSLGNVAALCVHPKFVRLVATEFSKTAIKTAAVINFPEGNAALESVLLEIGRALQDGAQEIDVVFPYLAYLNGKKEYAHTFITECKAVCGENVILKIILETGALLDSTIIADATATALKAGADFIKTSTGKIQNGATLEAAATILLVMARMNVKNKGIKISGGVRDIQQAAQYIELAAHIMGQDWVNPQHFRIGASQLVEAILRRSE